MISFWIITRRAAAREGAGDTRPSSTCSSCPRLSLVVDVALVHPGADPFSTGIRLRQANFQDEDFQEKNLGRVVGARDRCGYSGRQMLVMSFIVLGL